MHRTLAGQKASLSSLFPLAFLSIHVYSQLHGRTLFARNDPPVAFLSPPLCPRLGIEVIAQPQRDHDQGNEGNEPDKRISDVEHGKHTVRASGQSDTFTPDGKPSLAPLGVLMWIPAGTVHFTDSHAGLIRVRFGCPSNYLQPVRNQSSWRTGARRR